VPVCSTSARNIRGAGSRTGAGPLKANRRNIPAGSTATSPDCVSTISATVPHAAGYCTGVIRPPTPQAASGSATSTARIAATAHPASARTGIDDRARCRTAPIPAAAASTYSGIAHATHFWVSRSRPEPGTCVIAHSPSASPGPVAPSAGPAIATAASTATAPSTGLRRRRHSCGNPHTTTISNSAVPTRAHPVLRDAGTASPFQIPPRPARDPRVPSPGSARAANARTPAGSASVPPPARIVATIHGDDATTADTNAPAVRAARRGTPPGATSTASAVTAASSAPVGVRPAAARHNASHHQPR